MGKNKIKTNPGIIFLGICERALSVSEGNTNFSKWNIIGLKNIILSYIFPLQIRNLKLGLLIDFNRVGNMFDLWITNKDGKKYYSIKIQIDKFKKQNSKRETVKEYDSGSLVLKDNWTPFFVPIKKPAPRYFVWVTD